jgi:uroporphyrinogen decarboxylase
MKLKFDKLIIFPITSRQMFSVQKEIGNMKREEVVRDALAKKATSHLPVTFVYSNQKAERYFAEQMHMDHEAFLKYSDSDIKDIYLMDDLNMYISEPEQLSLARDMGFVFDRGEENVLFDRWGIGWSTHSVGLEVRINALRKGEDVLSYEVPKEKGGNFIMADRLVETYRKEGYAVWIPQYISFFERGWAIVGYEDFMMKCYTEPEKIETLLDKILEYKMTLAERICTYPVVMGHTGDDYGLQRGGVMSLEMWKRFFKPRLKELWGVYKKHHIKVCHHSCGDVGMYLDDMLDAGLDILHPVQATCLSITELSERYGKDLIFYGGIDCVDVLTNGTPDDVRRNVDETVEVLGKNGGLILSAINIMPNVPVENLRSLINAVNSYK